MNFDFGHDWPWIGGVAAIVLLCLLVFTRTLQADRTISRWYDRTWLAWVAVFAYLAHNIEEYGVDLLGRHYEFPQTLGQMIAGAATSPPNAFFLAVNLSLVWVAMPLGALLSRRHPLIGLIGYAVMAINFLTHALGFFAIGYNAGLLTAVVIFLPMTVWVAYALFGRGKMSYRGSFVVLLVGVVLHGVLMGSIQGLARGWLSSDVVVAIQIVNAALAIILLWLGERLLGEGLYRRA